VGYNEADAVRLARPIGVKIVDYEIIFVLDFDLF
jgi:hypothetical protein